MVPVSDNSQIGVDRLGLSVHHCTTCICLRIHLCRTKRLCTRQILPLCTALGTLAMYNLWPKSLSGKALPCLCPKWLRSNSWCLVHQKLPIRSNHCHRHKTGFIVAGTWGGEMRRVSRVCVCHHQTERTEETEGTMAILVARAEVATAEFFFF